MLVLEAVFVPVGVEGCVEVIDRVAVGVLDLGAESVAEADDVLEAVVLSVLVVEVVDVFEVVILRVVVTVIKGVFVVEVDFVDVLDIDDVFDADTDPVSVWLTLGVEETFGDGLGVIVGRIETLILELAVTDKDPLLDGEPVFVTESVALLVVDAEWVAVIDTVRDCRAVVLGLADLEESFVGSIFALPVLTALEVLLAVIDCVDVTLIRAVSVRRGLRDSDPLTVAVFELVTDPVVVSVERLDTEDVGEADVDRDILAEFDNVFCPVLVLETLADRLIVGVPVFVSDCLAEEVPVRVIGLVPVPFELELKLADADVVLELAIVIVVVEEPDGDLDVGADLVRVVDAEEVRLTLVDEVAVRLDVADFDAVILAVPVRVEVLESDRRVELEGDFDCNAVRVGKADAKTVSVRMGELVPLGVDTGVFVGKGLRVEVFDAVPEVVGRIFVSKRNRGGPVGSKRKVAFCGATLCICIRLPRPNNRAILRILIDPYILYSGKLFRRGLPPVPSSVVKIDGARPPAHHQERNVL